MEGDREGAKQGLTRGTKKLLGAKDMFIVLVVVMASRLRTYAKIYYRWTPL